MSVMRAIPRFCAQTVDDILTGLDNSARWARDEIGVFGLCCLALSAGMLCLIVLRTGG